jgi:hypothetical protein
MSVAKLNPMMTLLAALCILGAGALTFGLLAAEPQTEEARKAASNSDAFNRLKLEMTQKELIQVQADLRKTRLELKFWSSREETFAKLQIPRSIVDERVNQDPGVGKYLLRISELRDQVAQAERVANDPKTSPEIKNLRNEIMVTEKTIESLRTMLQPQIVAQLRDKAVEEYKGRLVQFKEQIEFAEEFEKTLMSEVERLNSLLAAPGK